MWGTISQKRLQKVAKDDGFLAWMEGVDRPLNDYLQERT
jgi:glycogen phosphorylase